MIGVTFSSWGTFCVEAMALSKMAMTTDSKLLRFVL